MADVTKKPAATFGSDQPGLFIVGMSRAATTWLGKCLNEHSQTAVLGENRFWGKGYIEPASGGRYTREQVESILRAQGDGKIVLAFSGSGPGTLSHVNTDNIGSVLAGGYAHLTPPVTPGELYRSALAAIAQAEGKPIAVDKTPQNVYWIPRIVEQVPSARFVVMLRDPYGFMLSYKHQGDRKPDRIKQSFRRLYHPIACALVWRAYARAASHAQREYGDRTMIVRFADVKRSPERILDEVQRHFGLEPEPLAGRVPKDNSSFPGGSKSELTGADRFWMNRLCGRMIESMGFERERSGFHPIQVGISVLTLPFWVVRNLGPFQRAMNMSVFRYAMRLVFR